MAMLATYYGMEKSEESKYYGRMSNALGAADYAAHTVDAAFGTGLPYLDVYFATRREYHDRLNRRVTLLFSRRLQPSG